VLATLMKSIKFDIFGFPFYGIQLLFVFSSLFRFLAWTFLKRIRVGKKSSIPRIIYNITAASANRSVARIFEFPSIYAAIKGRVAKKIVRDD
jgi:hypothetical protein